MFDLPGPIKTLARELIDAVRELTAEVKQLRERMEESAK